MTVEETHQLLNKVKELVGEYCNSFIFIANVDDSEHLGETRVCHEWDGGRSNVVGLIEVARTRIHATIAKEQLENEEED